MNQTVERINVAGPDEPDHWVRVGDEVFDMLTAKNAKVVRLEADEFGNVGVWVDNDWVGGGRFPWEVFAPLPAKVTVRR